MIERGILPDKILNLENGVKMLAVVKYGNMKNLPLVFMMLLLCLSSMAQDRITFKIRDTKGRPLRNVEMVAYNAEANDRLTATTNENGSVSFTLSQEGVYSFSYLDQADFDTYEVKSGFSGKASRGVTYDPKGVFKPKPRADRSNVQFATMAPLQLRGKPNIMALTIQLVTQKKVPLPRQELYVVSVRDKFKMRAVTNAEGKAIFFVPTRGTYEVDVDGIEAVQVVSTPNKPGAMVTHMVFYEKLQVTQITRGDTIVQQNITQTNGTNTHLLFSLKLNNYAGNPLEGEPVYLKAENGPRVYETVTDQNGECKLMLQKNDNYILNLKYEQGLHLSEAKGTRGFALESVTRRYRGSVEIERIEAERLAEMDLARERIAAKKKMEKELVLSFYNDKFSPSFRTTPTMKAQRPTDYIKRNGQGYSVQFKSSGAIGTPTIIGDNMFIPAGYYSPNFYCLNANTGAYKWGLELGESGISPAVHCNGVVLVNTYSCSLYAIDANTGKLLWSKWLAGTVYSTPSADGDKVYVVFRYGGVYVLSCFDLRTGEFKWINRVDSETIACPVVEGNEVHVASQSGFYYIFNKETGKPLEVITSINAVSSPTITDKSIFLTANIDGKDRLVEIDKKTYKVKKQYKSNLTAVRIRGGGQEQMSYNGSHPIVYKNKYVVLVDQQGLKVFDARSERILWEKNVSVATSQVPIVADNQVYLGTTSGEVMVYNIATGTSQKVKKLPAAIDAQPVYHKGMLFIATAGVLTATRFAKSFKWNQWNKDASHNLRVD